MGEGNIENYGTCYIVLFKIDRGSYEKLSLCLTFQPWCCNSFKILQLLCWELWNLMDIPMVE